MENGLAVGEVHDVVLVASLIAGNLLVWGVPPISINSELVHVFKRVKELDEVMSGLLLPNSVLDVNLSETSAPYGLSWHDSFHLLALPFVEFAADLYVFSAEGPLENVLDFVQKILLLQGEGLGVHRGLWLGVRVLRLLEGLLLDLELLLKKKLLLLVKDLLAHIRLLSL